MLLCFSLIFFSVFFFFNQIVLILVQDAIKDRFTLLLVVMSPEVPLGCDGFSDLVLVTLTVLRSSGQIFCRVLLLWNLSYIFLMIRWGYEFLGGRPHR